MGCDALLTDAGEIGGGIVSEREGCDAGRLGTKYESEGWDWFDRPNL